MTMGRVPLTFAIGLLAVTLVAWGAPGAPDDQTVRATAARSLTQTWNLNLCNRIPPLERNEIVKRGEYNQAGRYYSYRVFVKGQCFTTFMGMSERVFPFEGTLELQFQKNDFGEWATALSGQNIQAMGQPQLVQPVRPPPAAPAHAARPVPPPRPPDPALSLASAPLDPSNKVITSGGFGGLKVGRPVKDAEVFFGGELTDPFVGGPPEAVVCGLLGISTDKAIVLVIRDRRIVAFRLDSGATYRTKSGIGLGDTEDKLKQVFGSDPSFKRHEDRHGDAPSFVYYALGEDKPTSIRFHVEKGRVSMMTFGSSQEQGPDDGRC